jgi:hypothetical protein
MKDANYNAYNSTFTEDASKFYIGTKRFLFSTFGGKTKEGEEFLEGKQPPKPEPNVKTKTMMKLEAEYLV